MTKIFVFTAGKREAREHLAVSIRNPIAQEKVYQHCSPNDRTWLEQIHSEEGGFYAWGAEPGDRNIPTWESMAVGDIVLCVYDNFYRFISKVKKTIHNEGLAEAVWGRNTESGKTWEYMYFLSKPEEIEVNVASLGDKLNARYMGFVRISDQKIQEIENEYGTVEKFVDVRLRQQIEPPRDPAQDFLHLMRRYHDEGTVFQSAIQGHRYTVRSVDVSGCFVDRIDANEPARCTADLYLDRINRIRAAGKRLPRNELDSTAAIRATLRQGIELDVSVDREFILDLSDNKAALNNLVEILRNLRVDRSSGYDKPYKPAMLACVLEAVGNGELSQNRVEFDFIAPKFIEKVHSLGESAAGETQAAYAFFHLTSDLVWMLCYRDPTHPIDQSVSARSIREQVRHAIIKDTYWRLLNDPGVRTRLLRELEQRWFSGLETEDRVAHWIFQANPNTWDVDSAIKELKELTYTVRQHGSEIKSGDRVFLWRSGADAGIVALGTILSDPAMTDPDPATERFVINHTRSEPRHVRSRIRLDRLVSPPLSTSAIRQNSELADLLILREPEGTNFAVTQSQAKILMALIDQIRKQQSERQPRYTINDFVEETGFPASTLAEWHKRLLRKKHVVLQGPPGTGKTFLAERLARLTVSDKLGFWDLVQFHPSYAYEDFMQGIRPEVIDGRLSFEMQKGRFLRFCEKAEARGEDDPCVLIIDELNRANLSKVFGELMYCLEYRDKPIPLAGSDRQFRVPENVYLIGTMNTADRSIALVDHALRRRFSFIFLSPHYDVLRYQLSRNGLPVDSLVNALKQLNEAIDDRNYEIGISYFLRDGAALRQTLPSIWAGEIESYLEEYFYDQAEKVDEFRWDRLSRSTLAPWAQ